MNKLWENLNKPLFFGALALFLGSFLAFPSLLEDLKPKGPPIITRVFPVVDDPFTAYSNYVVKDSRTGLEWYCRHDPDFKGVSSGSAREWAKKPLCRWRRVADAQPGRIVRASRSRELQSRP